MSWQQPSTHAAGLAIAIMAIIWLTIWYRPKTKVKYGEN